MKNTGALIGAFSAALALAACGGHGSTTIPRTAQGQLVPVAFTIVIPPAITPQYISPSTQSATVSVNSGTPAVANCSGGSCSMTVLAPIGSDTFAVALYDAANGTGNVLSQGSTTQTINSGVANSVSVTFNGVVKSITIASSGSVFTSVTSGTPSTIPLTVTAKDAGGNTIIGTYASPVQLTVADGSHGLSVNGTHVTINNATVTNVPSSSTVVTASYSGDPNFGADRISAWDTYPTGTPFSSVLVEGPCALPTGTGRFGYFPCDLQSAYNLTTASGSAGGTQTIAVVDAYDYPNAESDLQIYRTALGLPTCTTANGCFKKVSQTGSTTSLPPTDPSPCSSTAGCWESEEALDIDMVSAICPNCHILLVEATSAGNLNLYAAVNEAAALGATEISNSWGGSEYQLETTDETTYFNHPGIPITASTGDDGFSGGTSFPASSRYVTAVGGTTLLAASGGRGWSESAWLDGGSGCSAYVPKPTWQPAALIPFQDCAFRMVSDVAADADTATPVWIYSTYQSRGWLLFGGTSASAPMIAAVYAISGNASTINDPSFPYSNGSLYDVTSGINGTCAGKPPYFCTARAGYDGPTGLGTPHGVSAFALPASALIDGPPERTNLNYHPGPFKRVCGGPPQPGVARCFALERTDKD